MFKIGDKVRGVGEVTGVSIDGLIGTIVAPFSGITRSCNGKDTWLVDFGTSFQGHTGAKEELDTDTGWNVPTNQLELVGESKVRAKGVTILQNDLRITAIRGDNRSSFEFETPASFDLRVGINEVLDRLEEKEAEGAPFVSEEGETFFAVTILGDSVHSTYYLRGDIGDEITIALGGAFRSASEAEQHQAEIEEKLKKVIEYAKTLNTSR